MGRGEHKVPRTARNNFCPRSEDGLWTQFITSKISGYYGEKLRLQWVEHLCSSNIIPTRSSTVHMGNYQEAPCDITPASSHPNFAIFTTCLVSDLQRLMEVACRYQPVKCWETNLPSDLFLDSILAGGNDRVCTGQYIIRGFKRHSKDAGVQGVGHFSGRNLLGLDPRQTFYAFNYLEVSVGWLMREYSPGGPVNSHTLSADLPMMCGHVSMYRNADYMSTILHIQNIHKTYISI